MSLRNVRKIFVVILSALLSTFLIYFAVSLSVEHFRKLKFYSGDRLFGREVVKENMLGVPIGIICAGRYLAIIDYKPLEGKGKVQIFDTSDFKYVNSSGFEGSGPGEIRSPRYISDVPFDSTMFSVFDLALQRLTVYSIENGGVKYRKSKILKSGMPYASIFVNDTEIVALCYGLDSGRIAVYDSSGKIKRVFGEILPGKAKETPISVHQSASISHMRISPDYNYFVVASQYADIIDIYDKQGNILKRIFGPLKIAPRYKVASVGDIPIMMIDENKTRWCYLDVAVTEKKIYALFSGNPFKSGPTGNQLHVFNMNGDFLRSYLLDRGISKIAITPRGDKLFGIAVEPKPGIIMFELK